MKYSFCKDFDVRYEKAKRQIVYSPKGPSSVHAFDTVDEVIRYLDDTNSEADMENTNLPYREVCIVEVNDDYEPIGDFVQGYTYEPYMESERRAWREQPIRGAI